MTSAARALEDCCRAGEPSRAAFATARAAVDAAERVLTAWIARLEHQVERDAAA
jgi:hypothetical protein